MIRSISTCFALLLSFHCFSQTLTQEQALEDLNTLRENLEEYHPGLYRYSTEDSIAYYFKKAVNSLKSSQSVPDLYKQVTMVLSKVRCGHTRPSMPASANESWKNSQLFLPLAVRYLGEGLFIDNLGTNEGGLEKGDQIFSINGMSVTDITARIFEHLSGDGFVHTGKYRQAERYFRYYYQLYVSPDTELYRMEISKQNGGRKAVTVTGKKWETLSGIDSPIPERAVLELEHRNDYSYMKIGTFGSYSLRNAGLDYEDFLEQSFAELKQKRVNNLVLDLRGNGGGDDNYGATLVSYFADRPFRYFERIEVTENYSGYGSIENSGGRRLMTSHRGLTVWKPRKNRFEGKVYVLTDGWSFSTCADVATVLHHHQWATLVGEETGGGYDGNTSGNSRTLTLPNSKIRVNLPMWMYTTANLGHKYYGRGAIPHLPVTPDVKAFISNKDAVLAVVEAMIADR